jgi:hypothetical protein
MWSIKLKYFIILIAITFLSSCNKGENKMQKTAFDPGSIQFDKLSNRIIYFGHMSVGNNIMAGVNDILTKTDAKGRLHTLRIKEPAEIKGPGFYHGNIGHNGKPLKKIDSFEELIIDKKLGQKADIAFFKFCYVDIKEETDINRVYKKYVNTINKIRETYPDLRLIHLTCPLRSHSGGRNFLSKIKRLAKNILIGDLDNVRRNEYNGLLRKEYGDDHALFDLAEIESTKENGERTTFNYKGQEYNSLYKNYTHDGGHLNKRGRIKVAKELLEFISGRF